MKIMVCGIPADKVEALREAVPNVKLRVVTDKDTMAAWKQKLVPADACIILPRYLKHKQMFLIHSVFGRAFFNAPTVRSAIAEAQRLANGGHAHGSSQA